MNIKFFANPKKYGKMASQMPIVTVNIDNYKPLIECIRDGFIPCISWVDTKRYLYEMMYNELDNNNRYTYQQLIGIIDVIENYYFTSADYFESDALMTLYNFFKKDVLSF